MQSLLDCTASMAVKAPRVKTEEPPSSTDLQQPEFLSDYSPRDKPWDTHRAQADDVAAIYLSSAEFERLGGRMVECAQLLEYAWAAERDDPGVFSLKLRAARFCRVRYCPVCQWRRSLRLVARFLDALPSIQESQPKARWLFLTLTVRNVRIEELRTTIRAMNKAWERLTHRKEFRLVEGWVRLTEVTRSTIGEAHPHFHCLLMVPSSYFKGGNYVAQAAWKEAWKTSARLDYDPVADVRAVKGEQLLNAVRETFKYAVKPSDMVADPEYFKEQTRQTHNLRFMASGGVLRDALRDDETGEQLLLLENEGAEEAGRMRFGYRRPVRRYSRERSREELN